MKRRKESHSNIQSATEIYPEMQLFDSMGEGLF